MSLSGISDIMNFSYTPFGQAMFNTPQCGEMDTKNYVWGQFWDGYNANARLCYNVACGADHAALYGDRPASCFNSTMGPYCQHGGAECAVNAIQACARKLSNNDWTKYAPFAVCLEESYSDIQVPAGATAKSTFEENKTLASKPINATAEKCADSKSGLSAQDILSCYYHTEFDTLVEMAANTVPHVTIPFVRIMQCDGSWNVLSLGDGTPPQNVLIDAVCKAPCKDSDAAKKCSSLPHRTGEINV